MLATFTLHNSYTAIRGYHIYKDVWPNPFVGEIVCCEREERNDHQGGVITASVTGPHRYSADLVQGGLEVPCKYIFTSGENSVKKSSFQAKC